MTTASLNWRDWVVDGVPSSGKHQPAKADLRTWGDKVETQAGENVKFHGAVGDGVTDDSAAIKTAWAAALAAKSDTLGGASIYFPPGDYLITDNNVFGQAPAGSYRWLTIRGAGRGSTILRFRPAGGDDFAADDKYYLYDGGNGTTNNACILMMLHWSDLLIYLEDDNLTASTDWIGVWRQYGNDGNQNFEHSHMQVWGPGAGSGTTAATSVFGEVVGTTNGGENRWIDCRIRNLTNVFRNENPQAVDTVFIACDIWEQHGDFIVIDGGPGAIRVLSGSWIWSATNDVTPQWLFNIVDSSAMASGNAKITVVGLKPEMLNTAAALVKAESTTGWCDVRFSDCNFAGGGIATARDVVSLDRYKSVHFDNCIIPAEFDFNFTTPNTNLSGTNWAPTVMGLITMTNCRIEEDMSTGHITLTGAGGRVIAEGCSLFGSSTSNTDHVALDFDSNPWEAGYAEAAPREKIAIGKPTSALWTNARVFTVKLPSGAQLVSVHAHKPAFVVATSRTMTIDDGDSDTFATAVAAENAVHTINAAVTDAQHVTRRTTANERLIRCTMDALTATTAGGWFYVKYI